jgi:hypothetical protein
MCPLKLASETATLDNLSAGRVILAVGLGALDVHEMKAYIESRRNGGTPFDIVEEGKTPGDDPMRAAEIVRPWAEAGATWWNEAMWDEPNINNVRARIRQGPPRI